MMFQLIISFVNCNIKSFSYTLMPNDEFILALGDGDAGKSYYYQALMESTKNK